MVAVLSQVGERTGERLEGLSREVIAKDFGLVYKSKGARRDDLMVLT